MAIMPHTRGILNSKIHDMALFRSLATLSIQRLANVRFQDFGDLIFEDNAAPNRFDLSSSSRAVTYHGLH